MTELSLARGRRTLPRGPHSLPPREVERSQRGRILQGAVEVVAERGWAATTVSLIGARAGVSRRTFYELFSDREHCFHSAYVDSAALHIRLMLAAGERETDPWAVLRARLDCYLQTLADHPAFACALMVEALCAGPRLRAERRRVVHRHAALLRELHARMDRPPLPPVAYVALMGGADELVREQIEEGRTARLPELTETLLQLYTPALEHGWT